MHPNSHLPCRSYQAALAAVLGTQFSPKSFPHGRAGVLRLARQAGELARVSALAADDRTGSSDTMA